MTKEIPEGLLNLLEMVVRCYDCCLSCSAHMVVLDHEGKVVVEKDVTIGSG
ncbi:MAG: F420-nonreducing hydrogenase [Candidatus Thorarchaeota archaeon]